MSKPKRRSRSKQPRASVPPDQPPSREKLDRWPLYVACLAVLVRMAYFIGYAVSPLIGDYLADQLYYLNWARQIAAGNWLGTAAFEQGPLYPYLLGSFFRLAGEHITLVFLLQMASGVAVCLLVYDAGRRLFDRQTALLAATLAAVYGPLVYFECMVMKSFLSPLLTLIALVAGLRYHEARRWGWLVVAGAAVGLACLVRENHVLLLIPLALWVFHALGRGEEGGKTKVLHLAVLGCSTLLAIAPATLHNRVASREWVLVTAGGGEVFYIAHGPAARGFYFPPDFVLAAPGQEHEDFRREARRRTGQPMTRSQSSRYWFRQGLAEMTGNPGREVGLIASKAAILFNDYEVPDNGSYTATRYFIPLLRVLPSFGWIAGWGLIGMVLCFRDWRRYQLLLGFALAHIVTVLLIYNFGRWRLGLVPLWILLAAYTATWCWRSWRSGDSGRRLRAAIAIAAGLLLSIFSFWPLLAGDFELTDAKLIGQLAMRAGNYALAEEQLRHVVDTLEQIEGVSDSTQYNAQLASVREMMAEVLCRRGDYTAAARQFQRVRQIPARPEIRQERLIFEVSLLHTVLRHERPTTPPADVEAELAAAGEELSQLNPHDVQVWALRTLYRNSLPDANAIGTGLEQAWEQLDNPTDVQRSWYQLAQSMLALHGNDHPAAEQAARQSLAAWPEQPYRPELEYLLKQTRE